MACENPVGIEAADINKMDDEKIKFSDEIQADSIGFNEPPPMDIHRFRERLIDVDDEMGQEDLDALKFLCRDHLPASRLEKAEMAIDIFDDMKKAALIDVNNVDFLLECLARIHRFDLVKKLGFDIDAVRQALPTFQKVFPFRILLMDISDDVDDDDVEKLRFLLRSHIKKKIRCERQSVLQLFVYMEQDGLLGPGKLGLLESLLEKIKRPLLVDRVRQLAGHRPRQMAASTYPRTPSDSQLQQGAFQGNAPFMAGQRNGLPFQGGEYQHHMTAIQSGGVGDLNAPPVTEVPRGIDRTPSAGTLVLSSSEASSSVDSRNKYDIPSSIYDQIVDNLKNRFTDMGLQLEFTSPQLEDYELKYIGDEERTRCLLVDWQGRIQDKGRIASNLMFILRKLDFKTTAETLKQWMDGIDKGQGHSSRSNPEGQVVLRQGLEAADQNNYSSLREAKAVGPNQMIQPVPRNQPQQQIAAIGGNMNNNANISTLTTEMQKLLLANPRLQQDERIHTLLNYNKTNNSDEVNAVPTHTPGQGHTGGQNMRPANPTNARDTENLEISTYKMTSSPRGWCVIINNEEFRVDHEEACKMPRRVGTVKDAETLQYVFHKLGFIVRRFDNLSDTDMVQRLTDVAHNVDHADFDCFVCCILTHGVLNHLYGSNGMLVSIKDLTATFQTNRCPSLSGKPKLFFLQACQGRDKMEGGEIERDAGGDQTETDTLPKEMIPNEADFLLGYATVPGYVSFRSRNHGSWYIRKLCELLEKYCESQDILSILTEVNYHVSRANANMDGGIFKQVPAPLFTLRKKLFLKKCLMDL